jgi:demethylmenaquinone methyltransferase/2-methoxy-6-polyprenyl-1,4-benzoquinol methylase
LKPAGRLVILEFSKPILGKLFNSIYECYSFNILPLIGKLVADDAESYRYLVESIRMHPRQDILSNMLREAGFQKVSYNNLTGGIVALHRGFKL